MKLDGSIQKVSGGLEGYRDRQMEAGKVYIGDIAYIQTTSSATTELTLSWEYEGQSKEPIPMSSLLHPTSVGLYQNLTLI